MDSTPPKETRPKKPPWQSESDPPNGMADRRFNGPLVNSEWLRRSHQIMSISPAFAFLLVTVLAGPVVAEDAADRIERANLLRQLNEDVPPAGGVESDSPSELPAARLEKEQQTAAERLQVDRFQDGQWRQLLESQRANAHRDLPAPQMRGPGLTFEREQRARDLSIQIQRQDLEFRQSNRR